jgi:hypothetical protein
MTPTSWDDSPVTEMLAKVIEAMFPERVARRQPNVEKESILLSYREDFPRLWNLDGKDARSIVGWVLSGEPGAVRTLILVWDGMPPQEGTINVGDFVLPFDWAFALSAIVLRECQGQEVGGKSLSAKLELPNVRILILDLESEKHAGAFSSDSLPAFGQTMPWIQIYKPVQSERLELAALFAASNDDYTISLLRTAITAGSLGFEALLEDLRKPDRLLSLRKAFSERDRTGDIEVVMNLYKSSMLSARTRHDVGNLLAPLLLVEALPQHQRRAVKKAMMEKYPLRTALRNLAAVIGLGKKEPESKSISSRSGVIKEMQDDGDVFARRKDIRFLLVDDQFSLGYQHLLASFLFGDGYEPSLGNENADEWHVMIRGAGELTCVSSAESILGILESIDPVTDWGVPRSLDVPCDILILDLRLWTSNIAKDTFFDRILRLCTHLGAEKIADDKFQKAIQRAAIGNSDQNGDQSEVEALALFPLLLSHVDPSIPIILFSSTHQRAVIELVSHRPNIVIDFAKPILSGYGEERPAEGVIEDLDRALHRAIQLHEARSIWKRLRNTEWKTSPVFECRTRVSDSTTVMGVYNVPPAAIVRADRVDAGIAAPGANGAELRKLLAGDFINYIQRPNHFDFASIPWEVLEGNLIPEEVLDDTRIMNPDFGFSPGLVIPLELRNFVPRALEIIRHKKAHGHVPLSDRFDLGVFRVSAMLQLAFLLDFLEGSESKAAPLQPDLDTFWNYIRVRHKNLVSMNKVKPPQPKNLISNKKVSWLDFIAYTCLWTAENSTDGIVRYLAEDTVDQVQRLCRSLSDPFWRDIDSIVRSRQAITGTVHQAADAGFVVQASDGFWGLLRKSGRASRLKVGDQCIVRIARRPRASGEEVTFDL